MKKIKFLTIILIIVLISMIGFFGIYEKNQNRMENKVKDYSLLSDLDGVREIRLKISEETEEIVKDAEGNVVEVTDDLTDEELQEKGYTKETVKKNEENLNEQNYNKAKKILEKRLAKMNVQEYEIAVDELTGDMLIRLPEKSNTDDIIGNLYTTGKFEIVDSETQEVLINNDDIKEVKVKYGSESATSSGTAVILEINFDDEGTKKLENITSTYTPSNSTENITSDKTTNEEVGNTSEETAENTVTTESGETSTEKKVTLKLDDSEMVSTSFEEPLRTGKIQLTVGSETTNVETLNENINKASNMAIILDTGRLPFKYTIAGNEYILSDITAQQITNAAMVVLGLAILGILIWILRYKVNGLLSAIEFIGFAALYLLTIRYTNVSISLAGVFGIVVILILNYILNNKILSDIKDKSKELSAEEVNSMIGETFKQFFIRILPICISTIVFCFVQWAVISSFGMVMFWGILLIALYNFVITKNLLKIKAEE